VVKDGYKRKVLLNSYVANLLNFCTGLQLMVRNL